MISKPKEYISMLLNDMIKSVEIAVKNYYEETFYQKYPLPESSDRLRKALDRVDEVKKEIFYVLKIAAKDGFDE